MTSRIFVSHKILFSLMSAVILLIFITRGSQAARAQTPSTPTPIVKKSLAEQLGFTAPILDDLQQQGLIRVKQNVAFTAYGHEYRLIHVSPAATDMIFDNNKVLLFRQDSTSTKAIWEITADDGTTLSGDKKGDIDWPAPGDWEQNGKIDFGMYYYAQNSCSPNFSYLSVYVLNPDESITSRFSKIIPAGYVVNSVEPQKNGSLVLRVLNVRGFYSNMNYSSCAGPVIDRYFKLTGLLLTDVSAQFSDVYTRQIRGILSDLTEWRPPALTDPSTDSLVYSGQLMELLMSYEALNQRDAGYALMRSLAEQAFTTHRIQRNTYLDTTFLPAMAQLYTLNQPFVPPEFVGPKAQEVMSFY